MGDKINQAQPIFIAVLKSGKKFIGGTSYYSTKWKEIPESIDRLYYRLPDGNFLVLHSYESYFHMVEAVKDLTGKNKGNVRIEYVYIMGKMKNKVTSYRIALFKEATCHIGDSRYKLGDITRREFDVTNERIKGLNPKNWR